MRFGFAFSLLAGSALAQSWIPPHAAPDPNLALLGRYLFYDQRMSVNGTQSCASCHRQELAFTDGRAVSIGATGEPHTRSAMSLVNVVFSSMLTWSDPNLRSLEKQALRPMLGTHPVELGLRDHESDFLQMLRTDPVYRELLPKSFTMDDVARAVAAFERTIVSARSPYDRYHYGGDRDAISDAAKRGEVVFFTDPVAGCYRCHNGFNFTDGQYHNTALHPTDPRKFKTPTLRNVAVTAPYMHDGSVETLADAIDNYAAGGRAPKNPHKDARLHGFAITPQNKKDLLEFLEALTDQDLLHDERFSNPWPPVPRAQGPPCRPAAVACGPLHESGR
jgi:cytochrome c peroxidase